MRNFFLLFVLLAVAGGRVKGGTPARSGYLYERLIADTGKRLSPGEEEEEEEEAEEREAKRNGHVAHGIGKWSRHEPQDSLENARKAAAVEQTHAGSRPAPELVSSFDGLGEGFRGPQGTALYRNPSDNALAVGPDHIFQIVNTRMAIYTKKGKRFDSTGRVLLGPAETRSVFKGFGGPCEKLNNGDAVVRYDQLANRWLIVMPTFRRGIPRTEERDSAHGMVPYPAQPGAPVMIYQAPPTYAEERPAGAGPGVRPQRTHADSVGTFCMCYAVSTSSDPLGPYYRYEFDRPLFPDYPRPVIWPDGYYTTSSTSDNLIQRQAFVVDREKMLRGEAATEQSFIINDVNFLLNADVEGQQLPDKGMPNIMVTNGGTQLHNQFEDDGIYYWKFHVDWTDTTKTKIEGPLKIRVAPYHYAGDGQLKKSVPQPGTDMGLDTQGDKLHGRLVYRRIGKQESYIVANAVRTAGGGSGIRWYEFRRGRHQRLSLYQQGTYSPGGDWRWLPGIATDGAGGIGIGYSYGGKEQFPGQRFSGRLAGDSLGRMGFGEGILAEGEAVQTNTLRWEDYTYTVIDPSDDATFWYVGDYLKKGAKNYSTKIGGFRLIVPDAHVAITPNGSGTAGSGGSGTATLQTPMHSGTPHDSPHTK
jgi:hypothetical protein